jgi:hypothetical protein
MRSRIGSMISGDNEKIEEKKNESDNEEKVIKLNLQSDIYSYTFYKFVVSENPFLHGELMIKCFLAITIQVMIIYLRFKEAVDEQGYIENGSPELNCVKLACAFFMHLQLYPEIEISLGMIRFGVYNQERFKAGPFVPMVLSLVKISGAVVAEVGSAYLIV